MTSKSKFVFIICLVYFKPTSEDEVFELFSSTINSIKNRFSQVPFIIGGDFNSRVADLNQCSFELVQDTNIYCYRNNLDLVCNKRGKSLVDILEELGFLLLNGRTKSDVVGWEQFFNSNFPERVVNNSMFFGVSHPILDQPFSEVEVLNAIHRKSNGKSPGVDGLTYECFKNLPVNWLLYLVTLYNKVFDCESVPGDWSKV
uniref:Endo/exonuclease/phosphatase domain-containing protein n=1 Tax=Rhodnius prolixus TaxID=13249 RepID=T1HGS1_RHOPR